MTVNEKLAALRTRMEATGVDAYIIPSGDAHQSEYVCAHWKSRAWISGFDGSAGVVVVTKDRAGLWTDGRYHIQAAAQLTGSEIILFKAGLDGVPTYQEWLIDNLKENSVIGFDGRTISVNAYKKLDDELCKKEIKTKSDLDLIGDIWSDRPALPAYDAFIHNVEFSGKSFTEKLDLVREKMKKAGASAYLIASLDDIAWLFNMRGNDVEYLPVVYSYAAVTSDKCYLFVNKTKINKELAESIDAQAEIKEYDEIIPFLKAYEAPGMVFINPDKISILLKNSFVAKTKFKQGTDLTSELKAVKNETEIKNLENCQIKDGVAMVRFIRWLKDRIRTSELYESDIHEKLSEFRRQGKHCVGASFPTIAAYMENAALMHYGPVPGKCAEIKASGMLLIDSGGQYYDGTTDITRTLILGEISDEMKRDFTLVLRSHIALASAKFLYGAAGVNLDCLARKPMWDNGLDYKCGTGHGVGYFLSVHEGPQNFGMTSTHVKLEAGMCITNEPGVYREGKWGIRTENTVLVEDDYKNDNGRFMKFRTFSYCPIDLAGIDADMLCTDEKTWLNSYHALVYEKLSPHLNDAECEWLREATKAI